jgi:hypothetical protein
MKKANNTIKELQEEELDESQYDSNSSRDEEEFYIQAI